MWVRGGWRAKKEVEQIVPPWVLLLVPGLPFCLTALRFNDNEALQKWVICRKWLTSGPWAYREQPLLFCDKSSLTCFDRTVTWIFPSGSRWFVKREWSWVRPHPSCDSTSLLIKFSFSTSLSLHIYYSHSKTVLQTLQAKNQERRFVGCHYFIFNDLRRGRDSEFLSANRRVIQVGRWLGTHFHFKELQKDSPFALVPILQWISDRILPTLLAVTIQSHFESQPDSKMPCGVANQQQSQQMLMNPSQSGYLCRVDFKRWS